jgi:DNA-binding NtrC family response regulator
MSGVDALKKLRARRELVPVIMISGHASVADAVEAVLQGATDFLEKPLDRDRLLVSVRNALRTGALEKEVRTLKRNALKRYEMVGQSAVMKRLFAEIEKIAPTKGRVLITGESGTGKELIARAIHRLSPRAERPFVKVNCAAIPAELIESELFGHERGSFTGAVGKKKGLFELAHTGTLFLDEIGDMAATAQAKVLRALQSGEITRVGGEQSIAVDVRVVAATNKDLEAAVSAGEFREDLFFRLNVLPLRSPSLRERPEDVPSLAKAFLVEFCDENGMRPKPFDADVLEALSERSWPGNVRELRNVVERMAILSDETISLDDLPEMPRREARESHASLPAPLGVEAGARETLRQNDSSCSTRSTSSTGTSPVRPSRSVWSARTSTRRCGLSASSEKARTEGPRRDCLSVSPPGHPLQLRPFSSEHSRYLSPVRRHRDANRVKSRHAGPRLRITPSQP